MRGGKRSVRKKEANILFALSKKRGGLAEKGGLGRRLGEVFPHRKKSAI